MKSVIASTVALAILAGAAASTAGRSAPAASGLRVQTLARIPTQVIGFAQEGRSVGWLPRRPLSVCFVLQDLRTGVRKLIARGRRCDGSGALVLARSRGFWLDYGASNLQKYAYLWTASPRDPRIRRVAFQSVAHDELLIPPVSDGRSVYFWSSPEDLTPGPLIRFDGRRSRRLTRSIATLQALSAAPGRYAYAKGVPTFDCAQEPAWSRDGRLIAFASGDGPAPCRGGLWVMNADGTDSHRVAPAGRNPDWSPDGAHLAFDASGNIMVADASGANARVLATNGVDPAWSPNGTKLAFERQKTVVIVGADGTAERLVATDAGQPDWSPDGTRLVVTKRSSPGLAIVSLDGTGFQSLTADYDSQAAWSPDGRWIAYVHCWGPHSSCDLSRFGDATVIGVIAPDGSGKKELPMGVDPEETKDSAPSWSPDAQDLAFARITDDSHIFVFKGLRVARRLTRSPPPLTTIFVRASTGRTILRAEPHGVVEALAVNRAVTAAIVRNGAVWRLELLSPRRRNVVLPRRPGPELGVSGETLVYRVGRSIFAMKAGRGRPRRIATAASTPVGLSVVGRRIAWAENLGGQARVRAVTLSAASAR